MPDTDYIKNIEDYIDEFDDRAIKNTAKLDECNEELKKISKYLEVEEEKLNELVNARDKQKGSVRPAIKVILTIIVLLTISIANTIPFTFFYGNMINTLSTIVMFLNGLGMLATGSIITLLGAVVGKKFINKSLQMYDNSIKKTEKYKQIEEMISNKNKTIQELTKIKSIIEKETSILENKNNEYQNTSREFKDLLNYLSIDIDDLLGINNNDPKKKVKTKNHY